MMDLADSELIRRIEQDASDARVAEAELCRRFAPRVRLYGLKHLRDEDRARDLTQMALIAVLTAARAGRIAEPEHADRFLLGTCRHMVSRMRDTDARTVGDEVLEHMAAPVVDDAVMGAPLDFGALIPCLMALDERAREVVSLSFMHERAADEIATRLGTTPGNVRVVRHRAIASLRRCLDGRVRSSARAREQTA